MCKKVTVPDPNLLEQLRNGGIPLDEDLLQYTKSASRTLEISQTGRDSETAVYYPGYGEPGFRLRIALENHSDEVIRLRTCRLKIPWGERNFRLLEAPHGTEITERTFALPVFGSPWLDPNFVLNIYLDRGSGVYPHDRLEGLLVGQGTEPLPWEFTNRQIVQAQLSLYDAESRSYSVELKLMVRRPKPKPPEKISRRTGDQIVPARATEG